jgi:hypothetical protein
MAIDSAVIIEHLVRLGTAVGYKLSEDRYKVYIEDLNVLTERSFIAACNSLRTSWERASFPPVGAIMNKAKEIRGDGQPNSIPERDDSKPKKPLDPKMAEALRRHEDYLKMTGDEYMKVMMAASKYWQGH